MTKRNKTHKPPIKENSKKSGFSDRNIILFIIIACIVLLLFTFDPKHYLGGDNGVYIALAYSILQNGTYVRIDEIGTPVETSIPPGYPIILAILMTVFGKSLIAMKLFSFFSFILGLTICYLLFRKFSIGKSISLALAIFLILNCDFSEYSHWVLTEAGFFAGMMLTIIFFVEWEKSDKWKYFILASVCSVLAFYIRPTGLPLIAAMALAILVKRKWNRIAEYVGIVILMLLPWIIRNAIVGAGFLERYISFVGRKQLNVVTEAATVSDIFQRIAINFQAYFSQHFPASFLPSLKFILIKNPLIGYAIAAILFMALVLGIVTLVRKRHFFIPIFIFFNRIS